MGSSELLLARERVDALLQAQNRLRVLLDSNASTDQAATASPKLVELRQLLGRAVRTQTEQQHEIEPPPAMPAAMQMQVVAPPPQPASNAGFAASAGGFEL